MQEISLLVWFQLYVLTHVLQIRKQYWNFFSLTFCIFTESWKKHTLGNFSSDRFVLLLAKLSDPMRLNYVNMIYLLTVFFQFNFFNLKNVFCKIFFWNLMKKRLERRNRVKSRCQLARQMVKCVCNREGNN